MKRTRKPNQHISSNPQAQMMALDLLSSSSFLSINKKILAEFGPSLTIFLSFLIDQFKYYLQNNKLQTDGSFFLRHEDIQSKTGMTEYSLRKSKNELREKGIITTIMKGVPQKEFYFLHLDKLVGEYRRINPTESRGLILPNPEGYNKDPNIIKPDEVNKNPLDEETQQLLRMFPKEWQQDKSFQQNIRDFIKHRKQKKASLTKVAASRLARNLSKYTLQEANVALERTMENGWQGVFPEKDNGNGKLRNGHRITEKQYPTGETQE